MSCPCLPNSGLHLIVVSGLSTKMGRLFFQDSFSFICCVVDRGEPLTLVLSIFLMELCYIQANHNHSFWKLCHNQYHLFICGKIEFTAKKNICGDVMKWRCFKNLGYGLSICLYSRLTKDVVKMVLCQDQCVYLQLCTNSGIDNVRGNRGGYNNNRGMNDEIIRVRWVITIGVLCQRRGPKMSPAHEHRQQQTNTDRGEKEN